MKTNGIIVLRTVAALCMGAIFGFFQFGEIHYSELMFLLAASSGYIFIVLHPGKWKEQAIGVSAGYPLAVLPFALFVLALVSNIGTNERHAAAQKDYCLLFIILNVVLAIAGFTVMGFSWPETNHRKILAAALAAGFGFLFFMGLIIH